MRKLFVVMIAMLTCTLSQAQERIYFEVIHTEVDDEPIGNGTPKTPMRPPVVYIDDYTLTFTADHPEYVLTIKNEESEVVYTMVVSSAETQATLPATLSGSYQIELAMGNWLFVGFFIL